MVRADPIAIGPPEWATGSLGACSTQSRGTCPIWEGWQYFADEELHGSHRLRRREISKRNIAYKIVRARHLHLPLNVSSSSPRRTGKCSSSVLQLFKLQREHRQSKRYAMLLPQKFQMLPPWPICALCCVLCFVIVFGQDYVTSHAQQRQFRRRFSKLLPFGAITISDVARLLRRLERNDVGVVRRSPDRRFWTPDSVPKRWMRPLHRLHYDRNVIEVIEITLMVQK